MIVFGSLGRQREREPAPETETPFTSTASAFGTTGMEENMGTETQVIFNRRSAKGRRLGGNVRLNPRVQIAGLRIAAIQHATVGITCRTDAVQIERCLFSENKTGVLSENTSPTITSNEFNRNGTGTRIPGKRIIRCRIQRVHGRTHYGIICEDDRSTPYSV